jgi:hypothetical protein
MRQWRSKIRSACLAACTALLLASFSTVPTRGQETEPTLQETLDWLKGKIDEQAGYSQQCTEASDGSKYRTTLAYKVSDMANGRIVYRATDAVVSKDARIEVTHEISFCLKDLNPDALQVSAVRLGFENDKCNPAQFGEVMLQTTNDRRLIQERSLRDGQVSRRLFTILFFADTELAARVAKAFAHAIRLSGGKAEPF